MGISAVEVVVPLTYCSTGVLYSIEKARFGCEHLSGRSGGAFDLLLNYYVSHLGEAPNRGPLAASGHNSGHELTGHARLAAHKTGDLSACVPSPIHQQTTFSLCSHLLFPHLSKTHKVSYSPPEYSNGR